MNGDEQPTLFDLPRGEDTPPPLEFSDLQRALWTKHKALLISAYLYYFVLITKHGVYIDGFAGPQKIEQPESWAAKLVLDNQPSWIRHFFFCDIDRDQVLALETLRKEQKFVRGRTVDIALADFNSHVDIVLQTNKITERTAAFCLLDQRTFECDWTTVQKIANRKKTGNKIEIFYFVPTGWLGRSIKALNRPEQKLKRWWGNNNWKQLEGVKKHLIAEQFRQRFLRELGYKYVYAWPIYDGESDRVMYHMVHSSDHREAPKLMRRAYRTAISRVGTSEQLKLDPAWFEQGSVP